MAGVAVATPTSLLPHQHLTLLLFPVTPKAHQICTFNVFCHTIFENDYAYDYAQLIEVGEAYLKVGEGGRCSRVVVISSG